MAILIVFLSRSYLRKIRSILFEGIKRVTEVVQEVYADYFSFQETVKHYLPDGKQYFEFEVMNEGSKAKFQRKTSRDVKVDSRSRDIHLTADTASDRHELIRATVKDWFLVRGGSPVPFSTRALDDLLVLANPRIIEDLEKAIRKANPFLLGDATVEDIDKEIESLQQQREEIVKRDREDKSISGAS